LKEVERLCKKYNVLFICDEVQAGFGRTGTMFGFEHEGVRPDMVCLGKSLSGGFMPVSAVLGNNNVMDQILPGEHGSTFGGNPLASRTAIAAIDVVIEEKLPQNAEKMGNLLLNNFRQIFSSSGRNGKHVKEIRGVGLFMAIEFHNDTLANSLSKKLLENGVISKPASKHILKMTPSLVLTEQQVKDISSIYEKSWNQLDLV
jgi:ornithine--oxo-acid transaminase